MSGDFHMLASLRDVAVACENNGSPSDASEVRKAITELELMRKALVHAVSVIQTWHNMGVPEQERSQLWDIYWRNAPEMKPIRSALAP